MREFDIAIVGAGIAGVGVAAALGAGPRVLILEQEPRAAYHSTGRSAAIFIRNYGNAVIRALSAQSVALFEGAEPDLFPNPLLTQRGLLYVADENGLDRHAGLLAMADGLDPVTVDEALGILPLLRRERIAAAAYERDAQDIDVAALHEGWLRKARGAGCELATGTPLLSARRAQGRWHIETAQGPATAEIIVDAAGAWADDVARRCGVAPIGLRPMRRSMAVLPAPDGVDIRRWPLVADSAEGWYAKPEAGKLYVSPAEEIPVEPHDAYVDDMVLAEGLHRFEQAMDYTVTRVERSWAGLRTFTPDRTPVAGYSTDGFFWLAGQGGYGIQTAPALSALSAALVKGEAPDAGVAGLVDALSPRRFA
jgi:D-arginine dehydrogenase